MSDEKVDRPKKLQRISQACDLCHRRSIRCRPSVEYPQKCQNCYDFGVECTYNRPSRRRRNPSEALPTRPNVIASQQTPQQQQQQQPPPPPSQSSQLHLPSQPQLDGQQPPRLAVSPGVSDARPPRQPHPLSQEYSPYSSSAPGQFDLTGAYVTVREDQIPDNPGTAWRSFALASLDTIEHYLGVYFDVVYPLFPLFHPPTLWERVKKLEHVADDGLFASVMAACALAAARARDGAGGDQVVLDASPAASSEVFFAAAQDMVFRELNRTRHFGHVRACGLLAVTAIQFGHISTMHLFMGHYFTLCAKQRFHDESHWPPNLSVLEKEERRRLFWAMYSFDIYTTIVFDSVMKSQETFSNVRYPSEVDDAELLGGVQQPSRSQPWLRGWNFTIDLYRVLEHVLKRLRRQKQTRVDRIAVVHLVVADGLTEHQVMDNVLGMYAQLPDRFKNYRLAATGDKSKDIYGFQAANIQATLQLVRMALFSSGSTQDLNQKCTIAEQLLSTFHGIAPSFLRALSTPLVYQLGSIGQILASAMEGVLEEDAYHRVRGLLTSMADLLAELESSLQPTAGASEGLRSQIARIDQHMDAQRQTITAVPSQSPAASGVNVGNISAGMMPQGRMSGGLGVVPPIEGFHLPPELVHDGNWPWPFAAPHEDLNFEGQQPRR